MGGDTSAVKRNKIDIRWQKERMENIKYGRRREGRWTPIRAKAQDTRANPKSWETHLVRKRWDIGLLRALSPRIMMMMMMMIKILKAIRLCIGSQRSSARMNSDICPNLGIPAISRAAAFRTDCS